MEDAKYGRGLSCSTVEGAEYAGGLSSVHWRVQVRWRALEPTEEESPVFVDFEFTLLRFPELYLL